MKKSLIPLLASTVAFCASMTAAQTLTPSRVGPVSQYGQLMTGKNSQGEGRIYGSCQGVKDGAEVQVRGMSLYWSLKPEAVEFWSQEGIATMVRDMKIQIVRAAMATGTEDWWGCKNGGDCGEDPSTHMRGYAVDKEFQTGLMKAAVEAAINQDIYVIIDWHSHVAHTQTESAKEFFKEMAEKYGKYDNVIFEVYNEPTDISWDEVKNYANQIIPVIREYSDNLILVGNPKWDQNPQMAIGNEVNDPKKNTAYTLHYYANSHCVSGSYDWGGGCEGSNGEQAIKAGLSVFLSEWGTGNADGGGNPDVSKNQQWQSYADKYQLSWANWSASYVSEGTAAFQGGSNKNNLQYTTSGNMVKGYLSNNPSTYTKCATGDNGNGGDQGTPDDSNSDAILTIPDFSFNMSLVGKTLNIAGKSATVEVFSLQGNKIMTIDNVSGDLSLAALPNGTYLVRARSGSASLVRTIAIK